MAERAASQSPLFLSQELCCGTESPLNSPEQLSDEPSMICPGVYTEAQLLQLLGDNSNNSDSSTLTQHTVKSRSNFIRTRLAAMHVSLHVVRGPCNTRWFVCDNASIFDFYALVGLSAGDRGQMAVISALIKRLHASPSDMYVQWLASRGSVAQTAMGLPALGNNPDEVANYLDTYCSHVPVVVRRRLPMPEERVATHWQFTTVHMLASICGVCTDRAPLLCTDEGGDAAADPEEEPGRTDLPALRSQHVLQHAEEAERMNELVGGYPSTLLYVTNAFLPWRQALTDHGQLPAQLPTRFMNNEHQAALSSWYKLPILCEMAILFGVSCAVGADGAPFIGSDPPPVLYAMPGQCTAQASNTLGTIWARHNQTYTSIVQRRNAQRVQAFKCEVTQATLPRTMEVASNMLCKLFGGSAERDEYTRVLLDDYEADRCVELAQGVNDEDGNGGMPHVWRE